MKPSLENFWVNKQQDDATTFWEVFYLLWMFLCCFGNETVSIQWPSFVFFFSNTFPEGYGGRRLNHFGSSFKKDMFAPLLI